MRLNGVVRRSKTNGPEPLGGGSNVSNVLPMITQDYSKRKLSRTQQLGSLWKNFMKHYIWRKSDHRSNCGNPRKSIHFLSVAIPSSLLTSLLCYLLSVATSTSLLSHNANLSLPWINHPPTVRISNSLFSDLDNDETTIEKFTQPFDLPILIRSHQRPKVSFSFPHDATISTLKCRHRRLWRSLHRYP